MKKIIDAHPVDIQILGIGQKWTHWFQRTRHTSR